jgi:endonuclease/exonuclease/phosphatase family metal-dependent hydrolase
MRLATFNVENLFERPAIMNLDDWQAGKKVLADYARLNNLICKDSYSQADKDEMVEIMGRHKGLVNNQESQYMRLRVVRGPFLKKGNPPTITAGGRSEWIGWFELKTKPVEASATENTARVIRELKADVMCVVEAEDRVALKLFNEAAIPKVGGQAFEHVMLIDGNDDRGIDVGILVRAPYEIRQIASHVDDRDDTGLIFSRDCAEYLVTGENGGQVLVLINHLKSKGYGSQASSDAKRKRQADRIREIYDRRRAEGYQHIAIAGDFNDTPDSPALANLLTGGLVDIMAHPKFQQGGRPGTWGNGTKSGKFDYIIMSPELSAKVAAGGVERRGVWGGKKGTMWPHFAEMTKAQDAASDHAALWVDFNL